jgi:ribosome biogenesis GTPase
MSNFSSLSDLGWQSYFQQQISLDEWDETIPARIVEQY